MPSKSEKKSERPNEENEAKREEGGELDRPAFDHHQLHNLNLASSNLPSFYDPSSI